MIELKSAGLACVCKEGVGWECWLCGEGEVWIGGKVRSAWDIGFI